MTKPPRPTPRPPWLVAAAFSSEPHRGLTCTNRRSAAIPFGELRSPSGPRLRSARNPAEARSASAAHVPEPGTLER